MSFGSELQAEREKLDVSLESLAEATKVSVRHLRALESNDFAQLPGGVFQRGMVRSYSRCLGLDEKAWLDRFSEATHTGTTDHDWAEFAANVKRTRIPSGSGRGLRWWGVLAMLLLLGLSGWAVWRYVVRTRLHAGLGAPVHDVTKIGTSQLTEQLIPHKIPQISA